MTKRNKSALSRVMTWAAMGLTVAAVVKELRQPAAARTWHGRILGVPYEFRRPTVRRLRERLWSPESPQILVPHLFGVGWTVNVGRLVHLVQGRRGGQA